MHLRGPKICNCCGGSPRTLNHSRLEYVRFRTHYVTSHARSNAFASDPKFFRLCEDRLKRVKSFNSLVCEAFEHLQCALNGSSYKRHDLRCQSLDPFEKFCGLSGYELGGFSEHAGTLRD